MSKKLSPNAKAFAKLRRKGSKNAVFSVLLKKRKRTTLVGHSEGSVPDLRTAFIYAEAMGLQLLQWWPDKEARAIEEEANELRRELVAAGYVVPS